MKPLTKEQKIFAEENHNLIYSFLAKHGLSIDDWYDIAAIGYVKAVGSFDDSKAVFSTFAYLCMLRRVHAEMRKDMAVRRTALVISLNKPITNAETTEVGDFIADKDDYITEMLTRNTLRSEATEQQLQIVNLCYFGYTQKEIASKLGMSQASVSREMKKLKETCVT